MAASGTAIRGRRVPLFGKGRNPDGREIVGYVCGSKPLPFGEHVLTEGVEVPGATNWTRLEAWVGARRVRPVYEGDAFFPFDVFAAWDEALAEDAARSAEPVPVEPVQTESLPADPEQTEDEKAAAVKAKRQAAAAKAREAKAKKAAEAPRE